MESWSGGMPPARNKDHGVKRHMVIIENNAPIKTLLELGGKCGSEIGALDRKQHFHNWDLFPTNFHNPSI
jgi:hypothetical protein